MSLRSRRFGFGNCRDQGLRVRVGRRVPARGPVGEHAVDRLPTLVGLEQDVEGAFARLMYTSLHLMHHQAIMGTLRTGVLALARFLIKRSKPLVKLH